MITGQQVRPGQLTPVPATTAAQLNISDLLTFMMITPMFKGMAEAFKY